MSMAERLPQITSREMIRTLERFGFSIVRTSGSHVILFQAETKRLVSVPFHSKDLKRGLVFGLLKQAGISTVDFLKEL